MTTTTYLVDGMTCDHCVHAVTTELSSLEGVAQVSIDLRPGAGSLVEVTSGAPIELEVVRAAVDEAGYDLVEGR
jgi:copper chaperone